MGGQAGRWFHFPAGKEVLMSRLLNLKRVRRLPALLAVFALTGLAVAGFALADNLEVDGDGLTPVGNKDMAFGGVNCGQATQKTALLRHLPQRRGR